MPYLTRLFWTILFAITMPCSVSAQTIRITLLDGRNGKPMKRQVVDVYFGEHMSGMPIQLETSYDGTALLPVPSDQHMFVAVGDFMADCRTKQPVINGKTFVDAYVYRFSDILKQGVVSQNVCGKTTSKAVPGTLTLFVRPLHWWEKMQD